MVAPTRGTRTRGRRGRRPGRHAAVAASIGLLAAIIIAVVAAAFTIAGFGPTIATAISPQRNAGRTPVSAPAAPAVTAPMTATIIIGGYRYAPETLEVTSGARITVRNTDTAILGLTADGGAFDTGEIPPGGVATITAPTAPGTYPYHCAVLPVLTGTLVVK